MYSLKNLVYNDRTCINYFILRKGDNLFSSGDILAPNAASIATYGIGRIDFVNGRIVPRVVISGDNRQHGLAEFTRSGKRYIYDTKVNKTNENINYFDVYDASIGIDLPLATELTLSVTPNPIASADLKLAPDTQGIIYAINGTTLTRHDLLNWEAPKSTTLESGYNVYSLVGLTNNANVLYVWASNRTAVSADGSYTPISSDIFVYDRNTLERKAAFHFPRTGLDITPKRPDDETAANAAPEPGRGLVDISNTATDKSTVLVVYDTASSDAAKIIRINEAANPVSYEVIITSADIGGYNIDTESPIPDNVGGFYMGTYSGDINAQAGTASKDTAVYHWNSTKRLTKATLANAQTTADLVIASGDHKGKIVLFYTTESADIAGQSNYRLHTYIWDGANNVLTMMDNGSRFGVEIEKPFTDGHDGIYFMVEGVILSDDADFLSHWNSTDGYSVVYSSTMELEVENPPLDGNNGFYFVVSELNGNPEYLNKSVDVGAFSADVKFYHCSSWRVSPDIVADLGLFDVPASAYLNVSGDYLTSYAAVRENVQLEFGIFEDTEHGYLFLGAGPIGGGMSLKVFNWNSATKANLTSHDIVASFTDKDLGGYASVATMVYFNDGLWGVGTSGGCDAGLSGFAVFAATALIYSLKRKR